MSVFVSNTVILRYGGEEQELVALSATDDDFEIVGLPKTRLDLTIIENIIGYRQLYKIRVHQINRATRYFLYKFIQADDQSVEINGVEHEVNLRDSELMLDLLDGYIGNVVLTMEFEDKEIQTISISRTQGVLTSSTGHSTVKDVVGTSLYLTYNYGAGNTTRRFVANRVSFYKAQILDKRWSYIDKNNGYKRLGYRLLYDIDFGNFGLPQTQAQLQDDRDFLKEFILSPYKYISGKDTYIGEVVNDFTEVNYSLMNNIIYDKTVQLQFKAKSLATNLPTPLKSVEEDDSFVPNVFELDNNVTGTLDNNVLG